AVADQVGAVGQAPDLELTAAGLGLGRDLGLGRYVRSPTASTTTLDEERGDREDNETASGVRADVHFHLVPLFFCAAVRVGRFKSNGRELRSDKQQSVNQIDSYCTLCNCTCKSSETMSRISSRPVEYTIRDSYDNYETFFRLD